MNDPREMAHIFNMYFANVGSILAAKIPHTNISRCGPQCETCLILNPMTADEVKLIISNLKETAASQDGMSTKVIKAISVHACVLLSHIVNLSFLAGIFPQILKEAVVTPVYKGESMCDVMNFSPILVLIAISKIFESSLYVRIYSHMSICNLLYRDQFGFWSGYSTELALICILKIVADAWEKRQLVVSVMMDLSKALDMPNHEILLNKLVIYGICGSPHSWLRSYLSNRIQRTKVNNILSDTVHLNCRVPQGSILGPLLFLTYTNDISSSISLKRPLSCMLMTVPSYYHTRI